MKHRLERVNEIIKRELSEIVRREINFDAKLVTIQHVDITPDLKQAHVFISVIGTDKQQHAAVTLLHDRRQDLQRDLSQRVVIKYTPHLHFHLDNSIVRGGRILGILEELNLPVEPEPAEAGDPFVEEP